MLKLYATDFLTMLKMMERAKAWFQPSLDDGMKELGRQQLGLALSYMKSHSANLPLSSSFLAQMDRLKRKADNPEKIWGPDELSLLLTELEANLGSEMESHLFLSVRPELRSVYSDPSEWFGASSGEVFKPAVGHMWDSARCFALEQWTASVFHAMCVLEYGLSFLHGRVQAKKSKPDWHNVITDIQTRIRDLRNPQSHKLTEVIKRRLDRYDEAAVQFRHFKDAWRNHMSHGRARYDESQAIEICAAVRSFMRHLASWKRKKRT